ncbi:MAG: hypothetical protein LQ338_004873 [Usnochroma carphineum]|nr:MAG: hypothetical protein LQ338_004873 [Usnochroma carphineum]
MPRADRGKENSKEPSIKYDTLHKWFSKQTPFKRTSAQHQLKAVPFASTFPGSQPGFGSFSSREPQQPKAQRARTPLSEIHMPYNNAAIPPSDEVTGSASLPLARVKRILALDEDIHQCSNNGAFVITVATEMFIRYLAEQAMNVLTVRTDASREASAVSRIDNLEFLADVIPKTTTYREFKEKKAKTVRPNARLSTGQTTLDNSRPLPSRPADVMSSVEIQAPQGHLSPEGPADDRDFEDSSMQTPRTNGEVVFEHYEPKDNPHGDGSGDVEMG